MDVMIYNNSEGFKVSNPDTDKPISAMELGFIVFDNFITLFSIASAVGFTLHTMGLVSQQLDLLVFTASFAGVWGLANAGYAWARYRDHVKITEQFSRRFPSDRSKEIARRFVQSCDRVFNSFTFFGTAYYLLEG